MKKNYLYLLVSLLLIACGGDKPKQSGLTPLPAAKNDPSNMMLVEAVKQYVNAYNHPPNSQFDYVRFDLDHDGAREGIVLFKSPHHYWCGWGGCTMAVFKANDKNFSFISRTTRVRGPVHISPKTTNDYRDIVVRLSGTSMTSKNVALKYDGKKYPENPMLAPEVTDFIPGLVSPGFFE